MSIRPSAARRSRRGLPPLPAAFWAGVLLLLLVLLPFRPAETAPAPSPGLAPEAAAALEALPIGLSPLRRSLLEHACSLVGRVGYFWGGKSDAPGWDSAWGTLRRITAPGCADSGSLRPYGLDCSGLISWAASNALGGSAETGRVGEGVRAQYAACTPIPWDALEPGDLVCFPDLSHIGLALAPTADGAVPVVHCSRSLGGVVITPDGAAAGFALAGRPLWLEEPSAFVQKRSGGSLSPRSFLSYPTKSPQNG